MENFEVNGYNIFLIVGVTFLASLLFVEMMKRVAIFLKVLDIPNDKRKIHTKPMPLLGGIGIFLASTNNNNRHIPDNHNRGNPNNRGPKINIIIMKSEGNPEKMLIIEPKMIVMEILQLIMETIFMLVECEMEKYLNLVILIILGNK